MKKLSLIVMLLLINFALSGCQAGQLLGPDFTPTPTATPTPSPDQKYCDNLEKSRSDQTNFKAANTRLEDFLLSKVGPDNISWAKMLSVLEEGGPVWVKLCRDNNPKDFENAIDVFSNYAKTGVELQISLNREVVPSKVVYAQRKIISCIDQAVLFGNAYTSFLRDDVSISIYADVSDCAQLDLYYEEIATFCSAY